jgi:hypothetical protein
VRPVGEGIRVRAKGPDGEKEKRAGEKDQKKKGADGEKKATHGQPDNTQVIVTFSSHTTTNQ